MIIDKHKTIFIHIPKNAGTSIREYFGQSLSVVKYGIKKHDDARAIHLKIRDSRRLYSRFAIVRNPYDRMVSWYFFVKLYMKSQKTNIEFDFKQWIKNPFKESYKKEKPYENWLNLHKDLLFRPQYTWVTPSKWSVTILKYENLKEELNKFLEKEINLPIVNKTEHEYYLKYYDKESLDIVYDKYKEDFEKFNYERIEKI
jgi:chondroitin 4-sulfotransferase 11